MQARAATGSAPDLYAVLRAEPSASAAGITAAFRRRVRELRPDIRVDAGTARRFAEVMAAYEVLRDPVARAAYDHRRTPAVPAPAPVLAPVPVPVRPRRVTGVTAAVVLRIGGPGRRTAALRVGPVRWERTR
ncbi:J domain-containing protein [Streptomyces sp. CA-251387]|uniref:J domain-containing protein n=1 Tax=Streptomyces sp. CA-251387 TaxID=3240064 RepID=UPI003D94BEF9